MPISEGPELHYGYSDSRPGYTPCGGRTAEVSATYYPDRVTCPTCRALLGLGDTRPPSSPEVRP